MNNSLNVLGQLGVGGGSATSTMIFIGALFAIMYFLVIRPQEKQRREQRTLLAELKKGDDVLTQGGLLGKIYSVADKVVVLEISNGVKIKVVKTAISGRTQLADETASAVAKTEEK